MSMIDYDARPVTPQIVLVGHRASAVGYSIRDFLSRNAVPYEWVDVDDTERVAGLLTGSVFVEKIFGWHGMGEWALQGYATQDVNIVVAITVFSGALILLAGLLSDVIYATLDPRVRVS